MHCDDFSKYDYKQFCQFDNVFCIGWIDRFHQYKKGTSPSEFLEALRRILITKTPRFNAHVNYMRGVHACNLCDQEIGIALNNGKSMLLGMSEIWIPFGNGWYAAPSLIFHYADSHDYLPPEEFIQAVSNLSTDDHYIGEEVYENLVREYSREKSG